MAPNAAGNGLAVAERLLPIFTTKLGIDVVRIHWSALPDYDIDEASKGLTDDMRRQELEVDWTASTDKRVFPEFGEMHVAKDKLRFDPRLPLTCGWDFGGVPAWCPTQLGHDGQWKLFPPLVGAEDESVGIYEFAERVAEHLTEHYCKPYRLPLKRLELVHFGDPYGNQLTAASRSKNDERLELRTAFDILRRGMQIVEGYDDEREPIIRELPGWGWNVRSGPQDIPTRLEAIRARLTKNVGGRPALIVCPTADTHIHAFYGAYHYKRRNDGTYEDRPEKNWWSHPQDALQYVAASLFTVRPKGDEDPRNGPRNDGHRSHAARRGRS